MGEVRTRTFQLDYHVPIGSMVLDQYGRVVGTVISIAKGLARGQEPPEWEVTAEVADDADTSSLQVMPIAGIVGSVNNA